MPSMVRIHHLPREPPSRDGGSVFSGRLDRTTRVLLGSASATVRAGDLVAPSGARTGVTDPVDLDARGDRSHDTERRDDLQGGALAGLAACEVDEGDVEEQQRHREPDQLVAELGVLAWVTDVLLQGLAARGGHR